jgi:predicted nuclease with RNAse H fold
VITAGVDLSSQDAKTAACVIDWSDQRATVAELTLGVDDNAIAAFVGRVDKLGIDVPLGWPIAFADAVTAHSSNGSWPAEYRHDGTTAYRLRRTDLWVWKNLGTSPPLSVSTDRIALPAMRAAALLSRLPSRCARDGSGVVVEVYPAAALRRWELPSRQYKRKENMAARRELVTRFLSETDGWLSVGSRDLDLCIASDDAFDAVIAALVARAAANGLVEPIPPEDLASALREGWIAVPIDASLARLARD